MKLNREFKNCHDLNPGGIIESGTSVNFHTGDWRSKVPVWAEKNCIHCMNCWAFCPDDSIFVKEGKRGEYNYDFCKGCGICAEECPVNKKLLRSINKENPSLKFESWEAVQSEAFVKGASIVMYSLKDAKEKFNI